MSVRVLIRPGSIKQGESFHVIVDGGKELAPGNEFISHIEGRYQLHAMSRTGVAHLDHTADMEPGEYAVEVFLANPEKLPSDELHQRLGKLLGAGSITVTAPDLTAADKAEEAINRARWNY